MMHDARPDPGFGFFFLELLAIGPQTTDTLASHFKRNPEKGVSQVLAALEMLGHATRQDQHWELATH